MWGHGVWGKSIFPQKIMTLTSAIVDVSLGQDLIVVVDDQGIAWSWGRHIHGDMS